MVLNCAFFTDRGKNIQPFLFPDHLLACKKGVSAASILCSYVSGEVQYPEHHPISPRACRHLCSFISKASNSTGPSCHKCGWIGSHSFFAQLMVFSFFSSSYLFFPLTNSLRRMHFLMEKFVSTPHPPINIVVICD